MTLPNAQIPSDQELTSEQSQTALLNLLEDLQEDKESFKLQRRAMLNIAEDALKAREELAKNNLELEILGGLIQRLGRSLEMESVMSNIVSTLRRFFPSAVIAHYMVPCGGTRSDHTIYIDAPKKLNDQYLGAIEGNILLGLETSTELAEFRQKMELPAPSNLQFKVTTQSENETQDGLPSCMLNLPMVVPHVMGGIINLSSAEQREFDQRSLKVVATVIDGAAATLQLLQSLITSERESFLDLLGKVGGAVLIFEASRYIRSINPLMQTLLGKDQIATQLEEVLEILQPRFKAQGVMQNQPVELRPMIDKVLTETQASYQTEVKLDNKYFQIFIIPMSDWQTKEMGGAIVLHDITTLKEIDRMKTEFVSVVSHQLKAPLTAINWYVEMLRSGDAGKLTPEQDNFFQEIHSGAQRMLRLINDLLNMSRLETGRLIVEPQPTQLETLLAEIIHELEPRAVKRHCAGVKFIKPKKSLPLVSTDQTLLRQVISNLITNALTYSPLERCNVKVSLLQKDDAYLISVVDEGIGIPPEAQKRIFEKFFKADNAQSQTAEGSGLGLYIAKMIMDASGGKIWFESPTVRRKTAAGVEENYGTIFHVAIPLAGMRANKGERGLAV